MNVRLLCYVWVNVWAWRFIYANCRSDDICICLNVLNTLNFVLKKILVECIIEKTIMSWESEMGCGWNYGTWWISWFILGWFHW